jgi:nucleoside-diphosphate-sugar epimerase
MSMHGRRRACASAGAEDVHLVAALIRFHEAKGSGAKSVVVWGTGRPRREFLCVDDMADALPI